MDDIEIKNLFSDYQPELSSSFLFMKKLQRNMEAMEIVKRHNARLRKRNRLAVVVAAVSGIVMGMVLMLLLPLVEEWASEQSITLPDFQIGGLTIIGWIAVGAVCVLTSLGTYEAAMKDPTAAS